MVGETCDAVQADSRLTASWVRQSNFNPIGKTRDGNGQMRVVARQVLHGFPARGDDGFLKFSEGIAGESGGVTEKMSCGAGRRREA